MIKNSTNTSLDAIPLMPNHHWLVRRDMANFAHLLRSKLFRLPRDFDISFLSFVVGAWYQRHASLRLRLTKTEDDYSATFAPLNEQLVEDSIICIKVNGGDDIREQLASKGAFIKSNFDIEQGPLLKLVYFDTDVISQRRLLIITHQLVADESSWYTLLYELAVVYKKWQGEQKPPKVKSASGRQTAIARYANFLDEHVDSIDMLDEKPFWLEQLSVSLPSLPQDWPTTNYGLQRHARTVKFELDSDATNKLMTRSSRAYRTEPVELLLTALALAFYDWCTRAQIRIDMLSHGRNSNWCGINLAKTVGWFSSNYPLFLNLDSCALDKESHSDLRLSAAVKSIKEQCRSLPNEGVGFGALRYLTLDPQLISLAAKNRSEVCFEFVDYQSWRDSKEGNLSQTIFPLSHGDSGVDIDGDKVRDYGLQFKALLIDGRIRFELEYDPNAFNKVSMERLSLCYQMALKAVVVHCCDPQNGSFTPSDFPHAKGLNQQDIDNWQEQYRDLEQIYPVSPMQMSYLSGIKGGVATNVSQICVDVSGHLDIPHIESLWQKVIAQHSILRTAFVDYGSTGLTQLVMKWVPWSWNQQDWRYLAPITQQHQFVRWYKKDRTRDFNLTKPPLMRATAFRLADSKYRCLISFHHGMLDSDSINLLIRLLFSRYLLVSNDMQFTNAEDMVIWCNQQDNYRAIKYWRQASENHQHFSKVCESVEKTESYEEISCEMEDDFAAKIALFGASVNIFARAVWAYVMAHTSDPKGINHDVIFAQSCSMKSLLLDSAQSLDSDVYQALGRYCHVLPVVVGVDQQLPLNEWLEQLKADEVIREQHSHLSLAELITCTGIGVDLAFNSQVIIEENLFGPLSDFVDEANEQITKDKQITIDNLTRCKPLYAPLALSFSFSIPCQLKIYYDESVVEQSQAKAWLDKCQQTVLAFLDGRYPQL